MGHTDIPPPDRPEWLVPLSTVLLGIGVVLWLVSYVLMTLRSVATSSYPTPLLALAINLSWELTFVSYVCEVNFERFGFFLWLLFDIPLVWVTLRPAARRNEWSTSPFVARHLGSILAIMTAIGVVVQLAIVKWWLEVPGRGHGDKTGKSWYGMPGRDTTELAYWTAGAAQLVASGSSVAMLLIRGHSGGQSYGIWLTRSLGTQFGLTANSGLLWWYWPEAHGYFVNPIAVALVGWSTLLDLMYGPLLWWVRQNEKVLPDGRCVASGVFAHRSGDVSDRKAK